MKRVTRLLQELGLRAPEPGAQTPPWQTREVTFQLSVQPQAQGAQSHSNSLLHHSAIGHTAFPKAFPSLLGSASALAKHPQSIFWTGFFKERFPFSNQYSKIHLLPEWSWLQKEMFGGKSVEFSLADHIYSQERQKPYWIITSGSSWLVTCKKMLFGPVPRVSIEMRIQPGANSYYGKEKILNLLYGKSTTIRDKKTPTSYLPKGGHTH